MTKAVLIVGVGSFAGGVLRYLLSMVFAKLSKTLSFPMGILIVNILGCFLIGMLYAYFKNRETDAHLTLLLMTGLLGGFTTFSTFSIETLQLLQQNEILKAILYVVGSVGIGILACFLGYTFGDK